jgi:hypothetical protein
VSKFGKLSRISCTSVPVNSKFAFSFQKRAESRDFDVVKFIKETILSGAALSKG